MTLHAWQRPEFEGRCAFAVSLGKLDVPGKESISTVQDGRRYLFSNPVAKLLWLIRPGRRAKAESHWSAREPEVSAEP